MIKDGKLSDYLKKMIGVENEIKKVIIGIDRTVELVVLSVMCRGHILFDGLPGLAKTTLCLAVARTLGGELVKFDGRPDFMPNQFMYVTEPNENGDPKFYPGPLIEKGPDIAVALLDEITRFVSQSQAFWFEIMNEGKLTLPTRTISLSRLLVVATKNKVTRGETFEIPQPQLDRFMQNIELGYPALMAEKNILTDHRFDDIGKLVLGINTVLDLDELCQMIDAIQESVRMTDKMADYLMDVVRATREPSRFGVKLDGIENVDDLVDNRQNSSGVSPRGAAKWRRIAKVAAFRRGSEYLTPEDALRVAETTLAHRIFVNSRASGQRNRATLARDFLKAVLDKIEIPGQADASK